MPEKKADQASEHTSRDDSEKGPKSSDNLSTGSKTYSSPSSENLPLFRRMIDSFKPIDLEDDGVDTSGMTEIEKINYATSRHPLARNLKSRHLKMIAFGGSIGTGLFIGSGHGLWQGGPAGQLISYFLVGFSVFCMVNALGEMCVQYPVSGSFNTFFSRFLDPSWGFALAIIYLLMFMISVPLELVACSITIGYWNSTINPSAWVAIFYVVIVLINLFGVKGFGEFEFAFGLIKVVAVVGFLIFGVCLICGAGNREYIGARNWYNPGAFNHGFKGFCSSFVSANFTFGGIELVALTASEAANPRKSIPRATKQVFWRVTVFYIVTSIVIGCLVPSNDSRLLSGTSSVDIAASPFVIAIKNGGVLVLPDVMNAVILLAVVSVCNGAVYGASRTLASLAVQGMLPKGIGYVDRMGRPIVAVAITSIFGLLGFLAADQKHQGEVFTWLFSICSLSFTWIAICVTHLRFRWVLKRQGRSLDEILFISPTGVWGSAFALIILSLIVLGIIWTSIWPINSPPSNKGFWKNCLALPVLILLWAGHKTYSRSWHQLIVKAEDADLDSGRRDLDIEVIKQEMTEERSRIRSKPFWYRIYRVWC